MDNSPSNPAAREGRFSWFGTSTTTSPTGNTGFLPTYNAQQNAENGDANRMTPASVIAILRQRLRPWAEFFKFSKFAWPAGVTAVAPRVKHNFAYFMTNYLCVAVILFIYCILTSFLMLLALVVLFGLCYTIYQRTQKGPLVLGGQEIPPSLMYTVSLIICFPLFALADVGGIMYWVIGSSLFLMLAHAFFYSSEEVPGSEFEVVTVVNT